MIRTIARSDDGAVIYVGGTFTTLRNTSRSNVGAVAASPTATSPALQSWNPNANAQVNSITLRGADAYLSGAFSTLSGQSRDGLAAVAANPNANTLRAWAPAAQHTTTDAASTRGVIVVDDAGDRVLVGGTWRYGGWSRRSRVAAIGMTGPNAGKVLPFAAAIDNGAVNALALRDNLLYIGGTFTSVAGAERRAVVAVDTVSGAVDPVFRTVLPQFVVFFFTLNGRAEALAVDDTHLYIGGFFAEINESNRIHFARVDRLTGEVDQSYTLQASGGLFALIPPI